MVWNYYYLDANTAGVQIKPEKGILELVLIGTAGSGGNSLTFYDGTSTSDPKIATIDTTGGIGPMPTPVRFNTALFATLQGGVAAKLTICYD